MPPLPFACASQLKNVSLHYDPTHYTALWSGQQGLSSYSTGLTRVTLNWVVGGLAHIMRDLIAPREALGCIRIGLLRMQEGLVKMR